MMINYSNFLEDSKLLLWNHYVNCCTVLGQKIDYTYEDYFNTLAEERAKEMVEYFNLQSN